MFLSDDHKARFKEALATSRKVSSDGKIDTEYGVAFYLLTALPGVWAKCRSCRSIGIDFAAILRCRTFSSGERLVVLLAQDLFGSRTSKGLSIYDMVCYLDDQTFNLCVEAIRLRKRGRLRVDKLEQ